MSEYQPGDQHGSKDQPNPEWVRERLEERMEELRRGFGGVFPPEFREHARAARREFWLALRSIIDARLEAIEADARSKPKPPPSGRVNID
jgi:hypothetical protein